MKLPHLPAKAAYIHLRNASRRNALSLEALQDLRNQLHASLISPKTGQLLLLPAFKPSVLEELEHAQSPGRSSASHEWLVDAKAWQQARGSLPNVLVLRSDGPVFSSGHDLKQLASASHDEVKKTFALCAEVMHLIRHSPAPIICPIQGLATAAGLQLALATDYPIALDATEFQLPGSSIGLPCTSPSSTVSRRASVSRVYRMFLTADKVRAGELADAVDVVAMPEHAESTDTATAAFESRVAHVVRRLASSGGQSLALGKWAYWTQYNITDGEDKASEWAARAMVLHARCDDAKEGMRSFVERRTPRWTT